jgi:hypothetical protein
MEVTPVIRWAEIEAEVGNYREGFVTTFRKYEGQATDEKDAQGRTVKVTVSSFARHMKIPVPTFRAWTKRATSTPVVPPERRLRIDSNTTRKILQEAPLEQVEQIIAGLPKSRQQAIAAAAGNEYMKERQRQQEKERALTPRQREERERATTAITHPVKQAAAGFAALGIVGHLEQATEELQELLSDSSLTPRVLRQIEKASDAWNREFDFARQMAGEES